MSLKNKICLLTGGTSGIGRIAATEFAKQGATLVIVGRDEARTKTVMDEIIKESGNPNVESVIADLASQKSIRAAAEEFRKRHSRLDVLINNAGTISIGRKMTDDDIETTFAVNHLAYFLMTNLLLDLLTATTESRVVNVSSEAHRNTKILDFNNLQGEKQYTSWSAYCRSKLCNLYFTYELARRVAPPTVHAMHPGYLRTGLFRDIPLLMRIGVFLTAGTPKTGADAMVHLAASPALSNVTGKYFKQKVLATSSPISHDKEAAQQLWEISAKLTGL